jgi:predicted small metal-binding protein
MKTMTCRQLGGACDIKLQAETFGEILELSMQHGIEMMQQNDEAHMKAIQNMKEIMQNPVTMNEWLAMKKAEFDALPDDEI